MGSRRKAREVLLKAFYLSESRGITIDETFAEMKSITEEMKVLSEEYVNLSLKPFALGLDIEQYEFALALAHTIDRSKETFNTHIKAVLENWDFSRVSRIDRIIMWIALSEISSMADIPPSVSINEAIELAKKYSSLKSPAFVNGILDAVARNMGVIK